MALRIKFARFWGKSIDILGVTAENYHALDAEPKTARERAAKRMVKQFTDESMLQAIEHLSLICFDVKKELFIRQGSNSFLADVIKTYVDKHDGALLAKACEQDVLEGIRHFKFSPQSRAVFGLLSRLASERGDPEYTDCLASNISNKIWQVIVLDRTPRNSYVAVIPRMQSLANDPQLLNAVLKFNQANELVQETSVEKQGVEHGKQRRGAFSSPTRQQFFSKKVKQGVSDVEADTLQQARV